MVKSPQWGTCMRPWIGPRKLFTGTMRTRGAEGLTKRAQIWGVIDERWNNTLHRPIHAAGLYLNPAFAYACGFNFDGEVIDGFLQCVQRMVLTPAERSEISRQKEIYRMASGMLGYDMVVQDRTTRMPGKLQFQILFILSIYYI